MKPETLTKLLDLRQKLSALGDISFNFSQLNRRYPINDLTELQASAIIETYESYLDQALKIVEVKNGR